MSHIVFDSNSLYKTVLTDHSTMLQRSQDVRGQGTTQSRKLNAGSTGNILRIQ